MKMFFVYFLVALLVFNAVRFCVEYFSYNRLKNKYSKIKFVINDYELPDEQFYAK